VTDGGSTNAGHASPDAVAAGTNVDATRYRLTAVPRQCSLAIVRGFPHPSPPFGD
jgi:hypothetical protein